MKRPAPLWWSWLLAVWPAAAAAQATESPAPAPRGAWLFEADVAALSYDRADEVRSRSLVLADALLSWGASDRLDLQVGLTTWTEDVVTEPERRDRQHGHGDAWLRAKYLLAGQDGETFAVAVLPYVRVPLAESRLRRAWEPGVAVPVSWPLPGGWSAGATVGADWCAEEEHDRGALLYASVVAGRAATSRLWWYLEVLADAEAGAYRDAAVQVGAGGSWSFTETFSLDLALYRGATAEAVDWTPVLRIVWQR